VRLYQHAKVSASSKVPEGLKDSECEKGNLGARPPIPYVPPTDLLQAKENSDSIKLKLPDGTVISMTIFAKGNPEEYLQHVIAVLRLINQKGLDTKCRESAKELLKTSQVLEALKRESVGTEKASASRNDQEAQKEELKQTQEMCELAKKEHDEAVAQVYEFLRNLLGGDPQAQWDRICREMHERDSWASLTGAKNEGKRPRTWASFKDCLELHKLTVFTIDAAERQKFYIQQGVRKPQRATVRQYVSRMEVLNGYLRHLPTLKNSPKAVATTKKGNIPFAEADLASIILSSVPIAWQNQYSLTHSTVPEAPRTLLPDLENIERVMLEKYNEKLKAQVKATTAREGGKGKPKKGSSEKGSTLRVPKKVRAEKFCQLCKTHGGPHQTHNTRDCRRYDKEGKPLGNPAGKSFSAKKPHKQFGGEKGIAYMTAMLEAIQKGQKRAAKSKKRKKRAYDSSSDSDSE
jgi:hypothetical protein